MQYEIKNRSHSQNYRYLVSTTYLYVWFFR